MMQILRCDNGIDTKMEYEMTNLIKVAFEKRLDNYDRAKYISDFLGNIIILNIDETTPTAEVGE